MTANTPSSRKAKGRTLQQKVRDLLLEAFPELTERDVRSTPTGCTGEDLLLSEEAFKRFPFHMEMKNQERLQIWQALEQVEKHGHPSLLIFKRNHSELYCSLRLETLIKLVREGKDGLLKK